MESKYCPFDKKNDYFIFHLRVLRNDQDVNNAETNETRINQIQNQISYLQSILLSSMTTNLNEEQSENELILNKENLQ